MLPFTREQFLAVFAGYNEAVWPAQLAAYAIGASILAGLWWRGGRAASGAIAVGLAAMWLWTGIAYHIVHFARINPAAYLFGALFVLQGLLLLVVAASGRVAFSPRTGVRAWTGWALVVYAMVLYPLAGWMAGEAYPELPMFGITPCPLTLFTFGILLFAAQRVPWWLPAIPLLWSLVGGTAAFLLAIPQDWVLLFSGLAVVPMVLGFGRRHASVRHEAA